MNNNVQANNKTLFEVSNLPFLDFVLSVKKTIINGSKENMISKIMLKSPENQTKLL